MFKRDCDLIPRTYSIKSYRRKKRIGLKRIILYMTIFLVFVGILAISFLTITRLI